jgi:hypothetical protein
MDRAAILEQLEQVEAHIEQGRGHIAHQLEIVNGLRQNGSDTAAAELLLQRLKESQALHIARRERLLADLAECDQ